VVENITVDGPTGDPRFWSEALYLAVTCNDYPQLWDDGTPVSERSAEVARRLAAYPPGAFAPFTGRSWTGTDYEGALACLRWPSQRFDDPPIAPGARYPDVPTLVLNGDLDNITPLADARIVAANFPNSTLVRVENTNHVTVLGDQNACGSVLYIRFVQTRRVGDTSCARRTVDVRAVARFPLRLAEVAPAAPRAGDRSRPAADAIMHWWANFDGDSVGLRGGRWSYSGAGDVQTFTLHDVRYLPRVRVSGRVRWTYSTQAVAGRLTARLPGGRSVRVRIAWPGGRAATARIDGTAGGRPLHATMRAP